MIGDDHELESAEGLSHQSRSTIAKRFYKPLRRLACLADELLDVTLTNVIVDYVLLVDSKASIVPIPEFIDTVYSKLPESSTLRQLLVDMMSHRITREPGWMKYLMKFHPEFLVDVLMSYASPFDEVKRTRKIRSTRENRCAHYHVHNDEVAKTADCLKPLV